MRAAASSALGVCVGVVLALAVAGISAAAAQEIPHFPATGWFDFKAPAMKDPVLQHAKETFIQYGCAYCHNVDLHPRGEAADLMHSPIVASDTDGSVIAQVLKAGIPQTAKLSPMPQFSDLSDRELADIARWIHYARMEGRYLELVQQLPGRRGDPAAGRTYVSQTCVSCHQVAELKRIVARMPRTETPAAVLKPSIVEAPTSFAETAESEVRRVGQARHRTLLENISDDEAANLMAYLSAAR